MIRVDGLTKYYGAIRALSGVSFTVEKGEIIGFLGLNGAGKTTALRVLGCLTLPSSGTVEVDGFDAVEHPREIRRRVGFLPEIPPLYGEMTVREFLLFAAQLRGMSGAEALPRVDEVVKVANVTEVEGQLVGTLSHGFRQRVGIAQAIVHRPSLLILDEPTGGLDPAQVVEVRSLIRGLRGQHTILVSSHILSEISQTCDRILVIQKGAIIAQGTEQELASRVSTAVAVEIDVRGEVKKAVAAAEAVKGVSRVAIARGDGASATLRADMERDVRAEVARAVIAAGADLLRLDRVGGELEDIFLKLTRGAKA